MAKYVIAAPEIHTSANLTHDEDFTLEIVCLQDSQ